MRKPLPGLALRLCDLASAHFCRNLRPPLLGFAHTAHGREIEPFVGGNIVNPDAVAGGVGQTQVEQSADAALARLCLKLVERIKFKICHVHTCTCVLTERPARQIEESKCYAILHSTAALRNLPWCLRQTTGYHGAVGR